MPLKNVFLFTGENAFALRKERYAWIKRFIEKHGFENLRCLDVEGLPYRSLLDDVSMAPFIAEKRLVVVDGVPRWTEEEVENLLLYLHPQVVLLFVSAKVDRRGAGVRALLKHTQCQTFPILNGAKLNSWIDGVVRSHGVNILRDARERLLEFVGTDQGMLYQEIQKLVLGRKEIKVSDVDRIVVPSREWVIWHLTNVVARGESREAILYAEKLRMGGHDPSRLWNILLNMLRQLTTVVAEVEEGCNQARDIAEAHDMHPFAVQSLLPLARRVRLCSMRRLIDRVVEMDHALKTGALRATADDSTELYALIDQCLLAISSLERR